MKIRGIAAVLAVASASVAHAALFSENFNTDVSANWTTSAGPGTNIATFGYDYSVLGIPNAPGTSDTLGLRLQANTTGVTTAEAITGLSTSPNGQSFSGDYVVQFYSWGNYGGSGTTMLATAAIGVTGNTAQRPGGTLEGVMFGVTGDGGSGSDYRAYGPGNSGAQLAVTGSQYAAGGQNNTAALYATVFPGGATSPAVQGPTQTSPAGTPAFTWAKWEIIKLGNIVTWELNDVVISTVDLTSATVSGSPTTTGPITLGGGNISLGYSDINNTGPSDPNLVFTLVDNLTVTAIVPEPAALGLVAPAALLVLRRRR